MKSDTEAALSATVAGAYRWAGRPNPHQRQWRRTLRWMLGMQAVLGLWFWGVILVNALIAYVVAAQFGPMQVSIFQFVTHGALWFPFSIMIITSAAAITTHVAQGRTRRSFIQAALLTVLAVAVVYGVLMTVGMHLEGALYESLDWTQGHIADDTSSTPPLTPWQEPLGLTLLTYITRTGAGAMAGLLVGVSYYRFGGWRGTGLLILTALPALAAQESISGFFRDSVNNPLLVSSVVSLVLIGAGAIAYYLLTRNLSINNPRT
ncbi:hypothetical protein [Ruania zhangjianzhongii]|uniref:hypothetical protein n=1 Tax=Ruania zhangjianzhongii TaxID=2603206 RepID=UPI0011CC3F48|nr:hypothetical protein [Ruania zhangjianzhongii]